MAFGKLKWFSGKKDAKEKAEQLILEEFDNVKKLLRKQTIMVEELYRGQQAAAAAGENRHTGHLIELRDSIFYLSRAFQSPGIMSRQHAQVLNMVMKKIERLSASLGLEMIRVRGGCDRSFAAPGGYVIAHGQCCASRRKNTWINHLPRPGRTKESRKVIHG